MKSEQRESRLSRERILEAAVEFVETHSIERLTLRKLGTILGTDATAFYRHYRNKDELLAALADTYFGQVLDGFEPQVDWSDTLRDLAFRVRQVYLDNPRLAVMLGSSPDALVNNARVHEQVLRALASSGLDEGLVPKFADMFASWVVAVNMQDVLTTSGGITEEEMLEAAKQMFAGLPADEFPFSTRYAAELFPSAQESFDFGLRVMFAAIRALAVDGERDLEGHGRPEGSR